MALKGTIEQEFFQMILTTSKGKVNQAGVFQASAITFTKNNEIIRNNGVDIVYTSHEAGGYSLTIGINSAVNPALHQTFIKLATEIGGFRQISALFSSVCFRNAKIAQNNTISEGRELGGIITSINLATLPTDTSNIGEQAMTQFEITGQYDYVK